MVVTFAPFTAPSVVTQERTALPFTCTVHAPQWAAPQPNFVPVSFSSSRSTHRSGVLSSACADTALPLRLNATIGLLLCGAHDAPLREPIQWALLARPMLCNHCSVFCATSRSLPTKLCAFSGEVLATDGIISVSTLDDAVAF